MPCVAAGSPTIASRPARKPSHTSPSTSRRHVVNAGSAATAARPLLVDDARGLLGVGAGREQARRDAGLFGDELDDREQHLGPALRARARRPPLALACAVPARTRARGGRSLDRACERRSVGARLGERRHALGRAHATRRCRPVARQLDEHLVVEHLAERPVELDRRALSPGRELDERGVRRRHRGRARRRPAATRSPASRRAAASASAPICRDSLAHPREPLGRAAPRAWRRSPWRWRTSASAYASCASRQRAALPGGPLLLLRERRAPSSSLRERGEPDLVADAGERGHQLGVDDVRAASTPNRVASRPRSWRGAWATTSGWAASAATTGRRRRRAGRRAAPAVRSRRSARREHPSLRAPEPRDLNEAQRRHQPVLRQELEVERGERRRGDRAAMRCDLGGLGDQRARHTITLILLDSPRRGRLT